MVNFWKNRPIQTEVLLCLVLPMEWTQITMGRNGLNKVISISLENMESAGMVFIKLIPGPFFILRIVIFQKIEFICTNYHFFTDFWTSKLFLSSLLPLSSLPSLPFSSSYPAFPSPFLFPPFSLILAIFHRLSLLPLFPSVLTFFNFHFQRKIGQILFPSTTNEHTSLSS